MSKSKSVVISENNFGTSTAITKIRIIRDILGADKDGVESLRVTRKRNKAWTPPQKVGNNLVESEEPEHFHIPWVVGQVVEMSEASCKKYIDSGHAVAVPVETEETEISAKK